MNTDNVSALYGQLSPFFVDADGNQTVTEEQFKQNIQDKNVRHGVWQEVIKFPGCENISEDDFNKTLGFSNQPSFWESLASHNPYPTLNTDKKRQVKSAEIVRPADYAVQEGEQGENAWLTSPYQQMTDDELVAQIGQLEEMDDAPMKPYYEEFERRTGRKYDKTGRKSENTDETIFNQIVESARAEELKKRGYYQAGSMRRRQIEKEVDDLFKDNTEVGQQTRERLGRLRQEQAWRNSQKLMPVIGQQLEDAQERIYANEKQSGLDMTGARALIDKSIKMFNAPSMYDKHYGITNWAVGLGDQLTDYDTWTAGATELARMANLNGIVKKMNNGQQLTNEEQLNLEAFMLFTAVEEARSADLSRGYSVGVNSAQSIPFMVEMWLTAGAGALAKKGLVEVAEKKLGREFADKLAHALGGTVIDGVERGATRTLGGKVAKTVAYDVTQTAVMPTTYANIYRDKVNETLFGDGKYDLKDLTRSFTSNVLETGTERWGGKIIDKAFASVIPAGVMDIWGKNKYFGHFIDHYINSPLGETGEELINAAISGIRSHNPLYENVDEKSISRNEILRDEFRQMFTMQGFGETLLTMLPMSVFGGAANAMSNRAYTKGVIEGYGESRADIKQVLLDNGANEEQAENIMRQLESSDSDKTFAEKIDRVRNTLIDRYVVAHPSSEETDAAKAFRDDLNKRFGAYVKSAALYNKEIGSLMEKYVKLSDEEKEQVAQGLDKYIESILKDVKTSEDKRVAEETKQAPEGEQAPNGFIYEMKGIPYKVTIDGKEQTITFRSPAYKVNEDDTIDVANSQGIMLQYGKNKFVDEKDVPVYMEAINGIRKAEHDAAIEAEKNRLAEEERQKTEAYQQEQRRLELQKQLEKEKEKVRQSIPYKKDGSIDNHNATPEQIVFYFTQVMNKDFKAKDILKAKILQLEDEKKSLKDPIDAWKKEQEIEGYYAAVQKWVGPQEAEDLRNEVQQTLNPQAEAPAQEPVVEVPAQEPVVENQTPEPAREIPAPAAPAVKEEPKKEEPKKETPKEERKEPKQEKKPKEQKTSKVDTPQQPKVETPAPAEPAQPAPEKPTRPKKARKALGYEEGMESLGKGVWIVKKPNGGPGKLVRSDEKPEHAVRAQLVYLDAEGQTPYILWSTAPVTSTRGNIKYVDHEGNIQEVARASVYMENPEKLGTVIPVPAPKRLNMTSLDSILKATLPVEGKVYSLGDFLQVTRVVKPRPEKGADVKYVSGYQKIADEINNRTDLTDAQKEKALEDIRRQIGTWIAMINSLSQNTPIEDNKALMPLRAMKLTIYRRLRDKYIKEGNMEKAMQTQFDMLSVPFRVLSEPTHENLTNEGFSNPLHQIAYYIKMAQKAGFLKTEVPVEMSLPTPLNIIFGSKVITPKDIEAAREKYAKAKEKKDTAHVAEDLEKEFPEVKHSLPALIRFAVPHNTGKTRTESNKAYDKSLQEVYAIMQERQDKQTKKDQLKDLCEQALAAAEAKDWETFSKLNKKISDYVTKNAKEDAEVGNVRKMFQSRLSAIIRTANAEMAEYDRLQKDVERFNTLIADAEGVKGKRTETAKKLKEQLEAAEYQLEEYEAKYPNGDSSKLQKKVEQIDAKLRRALELEGKGTTQNMEQLRGDLANAQAALDSFKESHQDIEKNYKEFKAQTTPANGLRLDFMVDLSTDGETSESDWGRKHGEYVVNMLRNFGVEAEIISEQELIDIIARDMEGTGEGDKLVQDLRDGRQIVFGVRQGNKILLSNERMNPNTPIHETTHLWVMSFFNNCSEAELYKMIEVLQKTEMWKRVASSSGYRYLKGSEKRIANEVLAHLVGDFYSQKGMFGQTRFEEQADVTFKARVARIIRQFLDWLFEKFGYDPYKGTDYNARVRELLSRPINDLIAYGGERGQVIARANAKQKQPGWIRPRAMFDMMTRRTDETIRGWLNLRDDLSEQEVTAVMSALDELETNKLQLAAGKWFANGKVRLPEDLKKIRQAVAVAERAKVDPMQYDSPMAVIEAFPEIEIKEKPIDPNTVPTLHKSAEFDNGIVIYDVDESEESRQNMRQIINTHFGKDSSPWCLLQGDNEGNLTPDSEYFWKHYNKYPKQVAFKDGHLVAFSANDKEERVWWNRQDVSSEGLYIGDRDLGEGKMQNQILIPATGEYRGEGPIIRYSHDGKIRENFDSSGRRTRTKITNDKGGDLYIHYGIGNRVNSIHYSIADFDTMFEFDETGKLKRFSNGVYSRSNFEFDYEYHDYKFREFGARANVNFDNNGEIISYQVQTKDDEIVLVHHTELGFGHVIEVSSIVDKSVGTSVLELQIKTDIDGNVSEILDHEHNKCFIYDKEGNLVGVRRDLWKNNIDEGDAIRDEDKQLAQENINLYNDKYLRLHDNFTEFVEEDFVDDAKRSLEMVLAEGFGVVSANEIDDENNIFENLDLMVEEVPSIDMMVEDGIEYKKAEADMELSDEQMEDWIIRESNRTDVVLADGRASGPEKARTLADFFKHTVSVVKTHVGKSGYDWYVEGTDFAEPVFAIERAIRKWRELKSGELVKNGKEGLEPNEYTVYAMLTSLSTKRANQIEELGDELIKPFSKLLHEFSSEIKKSPMYKAYRRERWMSKDEKKPVKLDPIQFFERYLIAKENINRARTRRSRGLAEFKLRMGVDVLQFEKEFRDNFANTPEKEARLNELLAAIKKITDFTLLRYYECGRITEEEYNEMKAKTFYIPLQGYEATERKQDSGEDTESEAVTAHIGSRGKLGALIHAKGGTSLPGSVLSYMLYDAANSINYSNRNDAKREMMHLIQNNAEYCAEHNIPVPKELAYAIVTNKEGKEEYKLVPFGETPEEAAANKQAYRFTVKAIRAKNVELGTALSAAEVIEQKLAGELTESKREELEAELANMNSTIESIKGKIAELEKSLKFLPPEDAMFIFRQREGADPRYVSLYEDGIPYTLFFPNNVRAAEALNGVRNTDGTIEWLKKFTTWIATQQTVNNRKFPRRNVTRDHMRIFNLGFIKYGGKFIKKWYPNYFTAMEEAGEYLTTGKPSDTKTGILFQQFLDAGANAGWTKVMKPEDFRAKLKELNPGWDGVTLRRALGWGDTALSIVEIRKVANVLNELTELAARFSVYKTCIELGLGQAQAVIDAHELPTNLTLQGSGNELVNIFNSITPFVNASIQGVVGVGRTIFIDYSNEKLARASLVAFGWFMLGYIMTRLYPDSDPDKFKPSDFERENYIIIGKNCRVALSEQIRPWWNFGQNVAAVQNGSKQWDAAMQSILTVALMNSIPVPQNITEAFVNMAYDPNYNIGDMVNTIATPQVLEQFGQIARNENFTGAQLRADAGDTPEYLQAPYESAAFQDLAYTIYLKNEGQEGIASKHRKDGSKLGQTEDVNPRELRTLAFFIPPSVIQDACTLYGLKKDFSEGNPLGTSLTNKENPIFSHAYDPNLYAARVIRDARNIVSDNQSFMQGLKKNIAGISIRENNAIETGNNAEADKQSGYKQDATGQLIDRGQDLPKAALKSLLDNYDKMNSKKLSSAIGLTQKDFENFFTNVNDPELVKMREEMILNMAYLVKLIEAERYYGDRQKAEEWFKKHFDNAGDPRGLYMKLGTGPAE